MRTATGLTLIALGAILGLAVNASTPGINLHIVGLIIALTGAAGLLLRSRTTGWLRRRVVLSKAPGADPPHEHDDRQPAYLVEDPAVLAAEVLSSAQLAEMARRDGHQAGQDAAQSGTSGGASGQAGDAASGQAAAGDAASGPAASGQAPSAEPGERG